MTIKKPDWQKIKTNTWRLVSFFLLLLLYLSAQGILILSRKHLIPQRLVTKFSPKLSAWYYRTLEILELERKGTISRTDLIELSIKNMRAKKTRTMITIGGMTIGIAAIVFLVSIGYGLESLVVSKVARLEEMKQADISTQIGGKVKINDKTLQSFKDINGVTQALPLIAVVSRVSYQNSVSDTAAYGVTADYLRQSAIKPTTGKIFDSNELTAAIYYPQVAGVSTEKIATTGELGEIIQEAEFSINPGEWIRVRNKPSLQSVVLGYSKRTEGKQSGMEIWGDSYQVNDGSKASKWLRAKVPLWQSKGNGKFEPVTQDGVQVQKEAYFAEINITLEGINISQPKVLGLATQSADVNWVDIASEAGIIAPTETRTVILDVNAKKQAVVNRALLKILGINEREAAGKKFSASFIVIGDLLDDPTAKVESAPSDYTIIGVTPDEKTPVFYVPFADLRSLGISNYSQVKLVVKDQNNLPKVRRQVEAMGYLTRSVADTVAQINSLFGTARTILALLGMVALAVAALGMFNTLTVSLLERTREVGLMKAMGMKSSEVQELFLTESMIMGLCGGVMGIIVGFVLGKILGIILSVFAIFRGVGIIDVSTIPLPFILVIVGLSLIVGLATGIYPARRATRISALNALRYE